MVQPSPADLWQKYGLRFKKSLGQNFLLDPNLNRKMAEVAGLSSADQVFEVGAGIGDLTAVLADAAGYVFTMEIDSTFAPVLWERFGDRPDVRIFIGDVLLYDACELVERYFDATRPIKLVANLPFYITSPILTMFLETAAPIHSLTVMVQREVGERLVAGPKTKPYSILTVTTRCYARASIARIVPATAFKPRPNVESAIVHLRRHDPLIPAADRSWFFRVVKAAFGQRRKALRNALTAGPLAGLGKAEVRAALESAGIEPDRRAESLEFDEFAVLADALRPLEHMATGPDRARRLTR